jgi:hypothetical protein
VGFGNCTFIAGVSLHSSRATLNPINPLNTKCAAQMVIIPRKILVQNFNQPFHGYTLKNQL